MSWWTFDYFAYSLLFFLTCSVFYFVLSGSIFPFQCKISGLHKPPLSWVWDDWCEDKWRRGGVCVRVRFVATNLNNENICTQIRNDFIYDILSCTLSWHEFSKQLQGWQDEDSQMEGSFHWWMRGVRDATHSAILSPGKTQQSVWMKSFYVEMTKCTTATESRL